MWSGLWSGLSMTEEPQYPTGPRTAGPHSVWSGLVQLLRSSLMCRVFRSMLVLTLVLVLVLVVVLVLVLPIPMLRMILLLMSTLMLVLVVVVVVVVVVYIAAHADALVVESVRRPLLLRT